MSENAGENIGQEFKASANVGSTPDGADIAPERPNDEAEQGEGILNPAGSAEAFTGQSDGTDPGEYPPGSPYAQETAEPKPRKTGAPFGNLNHFVNGSTWMEKAKRGELKASDSARKARRFAKDLIRSLGGEKNLSTQKLELIDHCKDDKEVLLDMYEARNKIFERNPNARTNIGVLAKLDGYIGPVKERLGRRLLGLGIEERAIEIELAPWEREQGRQQ
jgi:hypothetical protein